MPKAKAKNLLVIISDEHRFDSLGRFSGGMVKTPHLDALAKGGTQFSRAYTPSPMCVPARAALACGTYVHQNRFWDSATAYNGKPKSWMHHLRDAGYETTSIGKLHFHSGQIDNGFSREILPMHIVGERGWPIGLLREDPPKFDAAEELAREVGGGASSYTDYDRAITQATQDWLAEKSDDQTPFAGFVSFVSPHYPLIAPDDYLALYDADDMPEAIASIHDHPALNTLRQFFDYEDYFTPERAKEARAAYFALVSFMDHCVGQVMEALRQSGHAEDTLVIYTSDHGELLGDHGFWTKMAMYEGSVAVPMIINGPDIPQGQNRDDAVHLLDIPATALALAGLEQPDDWPGVDLIKTSRSAPDHDRSLFSEYHDGGSDTGYFMVAWGDWKYIAYVGHAPQLFNLAEDPQENHDLSSSTTAHHQAALAEGEQRLQAICNPDAINAMAFRDQQQRIEDFGGVEACLSAPAFNATPTPI